MARTDIIETPDGAPVAGLSVHETMVAIGQVAGQDHPSISLWDPQDPSTFRWLDAGVEAVLLSVRFSFDGTRLYVATQGGNFAIATTGTTTQRLDELSSGVQTIVSARGRDRAVFAGATVEVYDAGNDAVVWSAPGQSGPVVPHQRTGALSPDGETLATGGLVPGAVQLIELTTGREIRRITGAPDHCARMAISPDGSRLAAVESNAGGVFVASLGSGDRLAPFWTSLMRSTYASLAFSPDSRQLAVGTSTGQVEVLAVDDDNQIFSERVHQGWVSDVAFLDGQTVLSVGHDGNLAITTLG